jgi:hypothetical protein
MTRSGLPHIRPHALAWAMGGLTVAFALGSAVIAIADPSSLGPAADSDLSGPTTKDTVIEGGVWFAVAQAIVFSVIAVVGAVVAATRPRNPVGWLFGAAAFALGFGVFANGVYWLIAFGRPDHSGAADVIAWVESWLWIGWLVPFALIPLLFPTGAPPSPRWRVVGWAAALAGVVALVSTAFTPGPLGADFGWIDNPLGIEGLGLRTVASASVLVLSASALSAVASLVVRFRRSRGIERLQLRWVAAAGCFLMLCIPVGGVTTAWLGGGAGWAWLVFGLLTMAGSVAIALLRYRLYDIDVVINRALVYGALSAALAGIYLGGVLLGQLVLNGVTGDSSLAVAGSTLAVAALFRPARSRIQALVDRRFFRAKYDASLTLAAFSAHMRDEVTVDAVAAELRRVAVDTMQPSHVSLWLREPP